jgi:hypothetical protein
VRFSVVCAFTKQLHTNASAMTGNNNLFIIIGDRLDAFKVATIIFLQNYINYRLIVYEILLNYRFLLAYLAIK